MTKLSETESSELLGDWHFLSTPVNSEDNIIVPDPTSPRLGDTRSNPLKTRVPDKVIGLTSSVVGEEAARRVLPPWIDPLNEWGGGKWKEDGRKKKPVEKKEKIIPFKEIIAALLRNSGENKVEGTEIGKSQSCAELLKSKGLKLNLG